MQPPLEQVVPGGQLLPQVPQLLESVCKSTQVPLHSTWPAEQVEPPPELCTRTL
jgi:hypothetical protein